MHDPTVDIRTRTFVSVNIADTPGMLSELAKVLADHHVNIEGFSVERGSVRFLTPDAQKARETLIFQGFLPSVMEVFEMERPNPPGILARLGSGLGEAGVNIQSTFGVTHGGRGFIYLRVSDMEKAEPVLRQVHEAHVTT